MHGFAKVAKTTPAATPPTARPLARPSPRSPLAQRIQRITANENPFAEDAVVVEDGAPGTEGASPDEEAVRTLRPAGKPSGEAAISRSALNAGGGGPLPPSVRQFMEPRFGADFGGVQVHADGRAAELASSVSARAFAYGKHLYFNQGEYRPDTEGGKRVLAHELTHVVQQGGAEEPSTVRRLSALGPATKHLVAPWGSGPIGANHEVTTDAGNPLTGWRGYPIFPYDKLFWCHGHSLGTMYAFGYSIYSGAPLGTVLADEWTSVPEDQTRSGDIAVWTTKLNHSAIVSKPAFDGGGQLDHAKSELSTKNGQRPVATMTLDAVEAVYGTGVEVFRRK